jgi:hypothetical protein
VFLRKGCILPDRFDLRQEPFCQNWMLAEDALASALDTNIRNAGWHFVWMEGSYLRRGWGRAQEDALHRAVVCALQKVEGRFNAAEIGSFHVTKYPGFQVAKVTLNARQIQQQTLLDPADVRHLRQSPVL